MGSERYTDSDGNECDLPTMCRREPGWAANRIAALLTERQRHAGEVARLKARCHALEEQLGKLTELYDVTQARLEAFEEQEPDARTCAEWVATVALKSSDVHSAARRYLCGEQLRRVEGERDEAAKEVLP